MGVTIVAVLGLLQALLLVFVGIVLIVAHNGDDVTVTFAESGNGILVAGVVVAIVGLTVGVLSIMLGRGSDRVRTLFGIVTTFEIATAVYALVAERDLRAESVWALALPVLVLWFLYGSHRTQEYFQR